ncbi:hypothetical protein Pla123a_14110 [Posidoniimonas polymericola]|uniref:Uncharacterized protein n=1 Tax=Posidoniimonas polymericola TaxID=2528002 RepID=A0A5C5YRT4_9BACT|nr:hypothetical protein [Posidoniimonas polymericola]TWT77615.1 hypothetical protein Pla123a_14110 [Posidoniimonas polymericola]
MRSPALALLIVCCLAPAVAPGGHPVEDSLRNPRIDQLEREKLERVWREIAELPPAAAARELRKEYKELGSVPGQETHFRGVMHKDPHGVTIIKTVNSDIYDAKITTTCREAGIGRLLHTTREVEFELKHPEGSAKVKLAAQIEQELKSDKYRDLFMTARQKYADLLASSGEEATHAAFEKDFHPSGPHGLEILPRLVFSQGDCFISATLSGKGIMGAISAHDRSSVTTQMIKDIMPPYEVHVWAEEMR